MNGIQTIEDNTEAQQFLLKEGLLIALQTQPTKPGPYMRTLINSGLEHHTLGILWTGCKAENDNGYMAVYAKRESLDPSQWTALAAFLVSIFTKPGSLSAQLFAGINPRNQANKALFTPFSMTLETPDNFTMTPFTSLPLHTAGPGQNATGPFQPFVYCRFRDRPNPERVTRFES